MSKAGLQKGTLLHNRYEIDRELGRGGFSIVYSAKDLLSFRQTAVKEFFPEKWATRATDGQGVQISTLPDEQDKSNRGLAAFRKEAGIMRVLSNLPYISRIQDSFAENGTEYLVMNFIEGESLQPVDSTSATARFKSKPDTEDFLLMMEKVLYAMEKMHEAGIIHRDISPRNMLLTREKDLYLIDFGSAMATDPASPFYSEEIFEHPGFQAPEYARPSEQGPWTDIYSVCAVIVYLLTGYAVPVPSDRLKFDEVPQLLMRCGLNSRQQNALLKGLAIDPAMRTQSAYELRLNLCQTLYEVAEKRSVHYAAYTDMGDRPQNQDNLTVDGLFCYVGSDFQKNGVLVCESEELHVAAIFDGVGGAAAGELSSRAAAQAMIHFMEQNQTSNILPERLLDELLDQMNEKILILAQKVGRTATTISVVMWKGNHYYTANIGDSPIYLLRKRKLLRLSTPHTQAEEKKLLGKPIVSKDFHTLTRYLGKENLAGSQMRTFGRGHLEKGDVFFLCSDGVTDEIDDAVLRKCLLHKPVRALDSIWKILRQKSNKDNCSAIIVKF